MRLFFISLFLGIGSLNAQVSPPSQPTSGPGGSNYPHASVRATDYDDGTTGFWMLEPGSPAPDSADVIVFFHGFGAVNPKLYGGWMTHLCKKGNIVIWPRYQIDEQSPGTQYNADAGTGIQRAIDSLNTLPNHVRPRTQNLAYVGHSVGGVLSANMGMVGHTQFGLPQAKAVFSCQPGANADIKFTTYRDMPASMKMLVVAGDGDVLVGDADAQLIWDSTLFVPTSNKNYVIHYADNHGNPALTAGHDDPLAIDNDYDNGINSFFVIASTFAAKTDAVDYFCIWKLSEALVNCAFYGIDCQYALGDTPQQKSMGQWSDNSDVRLLTVIPSTTSRESFEKNTVKIYPQPASEILFVESENNGNYEWLTMDGRSIGSGSIIPGKNTIECEGMNTGIYLLRIHTADGNSSSSRFILH